MPDYDAIIIGAGHNGLTAGTMLAKAGLKCINFEKNDRVGGFASTYELFKGYKHNIGAWVWMVYGKRLYEELELGKWGLELIVPEVACVSTGAPGEKPFIQYSDLNKMADHLTNDHGPQATEGLMNLYNFMRTIGVGLELALYNPPISISRIMELIPSAEGKDALRRCFYESCKDLCDEFFEQGIANNIKGSLACTSVDGEYFGPMSPGSAWQLAYHIAMAGVGEFYKLPRGGMIMISEAIRKSYESHGGQVKFSTPVKKILLENGKAVGVELENGQKVSSKVVLSNLEARSTFTRLLNPDQLPANFVGMVKNIKYRNPFIQIFLCLKEVPQFTGENAVLNKDKGNFLVGYVPSLEFVEQCWDACKYGQLPKVPMTNYYVPSMYDPSFAPPGRHSATMYIMMFPPHVPADKYEKMKEEFADRAIDKMNELAPNFKDSIIDRKVWGPREYERVMGATNGDYTHGAMELSQMLDFRPVPGWTEYRTPVKNLYLCGSACHPSSGVTSIPGYNSSRIVLKDLKQADGGKTGKGKSR